jgi:predicted DNA-binding antitoxin AbrB/MazE fold protein
MSIIKATFRNGRIEPDEPLDLPDGTELQISLPENDDEPMSQAEIDRVLTAMDQIIPFDRSPEEEARLETDRQARKEWEKDHFFERAEKLRKMWE